MLLAQPYSGLETILLGLRILDTAFLLGRTVFLSGRSRDRDVLSEVRDEVHDAENSRLAYFRKREVRFHDLAREVEGRSQTQIHVGEQLVEDADRRIDELRQILDASSKPSAASSQQPNWDGSASGDRAQILNLAQAGFRTDEIARCVDCSEQDVQSTLENALGANHTDAA